MCEERGLQWIEPPFTQKYCTVYQVPSWFQRSGSKKGQDEAGASLERGFILLGFASAVIFGWDAPASFSALLSGLF